MKNHKISNRYHCEGSTRGNPRFNWRFLVRHGGLGMTLCVTFYFLLFTSAYAKPKPKTYRVWIWQENGDCLWNIAKKFYGDGKKWKIIYEANKDRIKDPRKIYPKQILIIP